MTRLEEAKKLFKKHRDMGQNSPFSNFEVLDYIFNEIFEQEPSKQENRWLRKVEKETGLTCEYEQEKKFLATEYF